jgi:hypothetical protein
MLFLLLLVGMGARNGGRTVPDRPEDGLRAASALGAAAASGVDLARVAGPFLDNPHHLSVGQRVAEADVHGFGISQRW